MPVRALLFDADGQDHELSLSTEALPQPSDRQLLWIDLIGGWPPELPQLVAGLKLDAAAIRQAQRGQAQVHRLIHFEGTMTLTVKAVEGHPSNFIPLTIIAGENVVLTAQDSPIQKLSELTEQMQGDTQLGQLDASAFVLVVLSRVLESYFQAINRFEEAIDRLDERVLSTRKPTREPLNELVKLRRQVGVLRRELSAHRPLFMRLTSPDFAVYTDEAQQPQFAALLDQFEHVLDGVDHVRELVVGSFELYMTSLGQRTNDIMRMLTIVTLALGLLAAIAGLMGMNFQADVFKSGNTGFRNVIIGSGLLILALLGLIRWRQWL